MLCWSPFPPVSQSGTNTWWILETTRCLLPLDHVTTNRKSACVSIYWTSSPMRWAGFAFNIIHWECSVQHIWWWHMSICLIVQGFIIRNTRVHHMSERANENTVEHHWTFCRCACKVDDWQTNWLDLWTGCRIVVSADRPSLFFLFIILEFCTVCVLFESFPQSPLSWCKSWDYLRNIALVTCGTLPCLGLLIISYIISVQIIWTS